ncbi:MAG: hypothetical protein P3T54_00225 [Dehalogenimonas sp.]|nr:hypothetical protein [Dehalogenimonas sp.]
MGYIKIFKASDDSQVSASPVLTNAVTATLRADQNEIGAFEKLYALADDGYVVSTVVITPTGDNATKVQLDSDNAGSPSGSPEAYGDPLSLGTVGDTTKVYFHVRMKAVDTEDPENDDSVTLEATGVAAAE